MNQEYEYYNPGPEPSGNGSFSNENPKRPKKKVNKAVVGKVAGLAVLFGVVGGLTFQGVNYISGRILGTGNGSSQNSAQVQTVQTQEDSGEELQGSDITQIAANSMPFVVSIQNMSVQQVQDFFGGTREQTQTSVGSGIIVGQNNSELMIVTNNHVVEGSTTLTVTFNDETSVEASVKGTDSTKDLAVVAVPIRQIGDETKNGIKVAVLGNSDELQVGEEVIAIGNALGYGQSVTNGIVSAKDREISGYDGTLIQTNAAINPGNSGGALLNTKGEVIGINCAKISDSSVEGMGYAIPVSEVSDIIQNLMNQQTKTRVSEEEQGSLGVQVMDIDETTAERYGMPQGVYITGLTQDNTDSDLQRGYIITALNGTSITDTNDLQNELGYYRAGEDVTLTVQSAGSDGEYTSQDITVTLISSQSNQ